MCYSSCLVENKLQIHLSFFCKALNRKIGLHCNNVCTAWASLGFCGMTVYRVQCEAINLSAGRGFVSWTCRDYNLVSLLDTK